ncbi:MAG: FHA domain-containing protein [Planctomycetota bacterium]
MSAELLEVTITAGPTAGQRVRINHSPAAFGRDAENPLVVDLPTVSRVHGELRYDDQRWVLVNLSPNGTQLNRRPVGRRPRPLEDGDQIVVGNQPVLTVALRDSGEDDAGVSVGRGSTQDVGATPAPPTKASISPRTKLWAGIAGFWVVVFVGAFLLTGGDDGPQAGINAVPRLTDAQIAASIRAPLAKQEPSPRNAAEHFDEAVAAGQMMNADPKNRFLSYYSYKTALSYVLGDDFLDERDDWGGKPDSERATAQRLYFELQDELIDDVTRLYNDAYGKLADGRYAAAQRGFEKVYALYNDSSSDVYRNALRQRNVARQNQSR